MSAPVLTPEELLRYSRNLRLESFGREGQERLRSSRVLVVGLGGLGSPASLYLAAAGVGRLGLADFDVVAPHNLQRQILHGTGDAGRAKLDSARDRLRALNPHVDLVGHPDGIRPDNALDLFREYDLVLDGSDNFGTRYLVNDAAFHAGIPVVSGSVFQFEGQVTVLAPHRGGPCLRCLFPHPPGAGEVPNCDEAGVLGAVCGLVGSVQAAEAVKLLAGVGEPLVGRLLVIDTLGASFRTLRVARDPACALCGEARTLRPEDLRAPGAYPGNSCAAASPSGSRSPVMDLPDPADLPEEIDAATAAAWLASERPPLVVDVREPFEHAIARIEPSVLHPLRQLPATMADLPPDRPLLVLCHHGMRSLNGSRYLRARGRAATSLAGGIDAWSLDVDPAVPRY